MFTKLSEVNVAYSVELRRQLILSPGILSVILQNCLGFCQEI